MTSPKAYPASRLPGPAVRMFDLECGVEDPDATVHRGAHQAQTVSMAPEVEWALTDECRRCTRCGMAVDDDGYCSVLCARHEPTRTRLSHE